MVWVFIGQVLLIGCLLVFDAVIPPWLLGLMVATALLLPILAYLTILAQRQVWRAWLTTLRDTCDFVASCFATLLDCFRRRSIWRFWRFVRSLRRCPSTGDEWVKLSLFPFKLYVLMAVPFLWLSGLVAGLVEPGFADLDRTQVTFAISAGYLLCLAVLLFGALVQALFSRRGRSSQTVFVFVVGVVFFNMLKQ